MFFSCRWQQSTILDTFALEFADRSAKRLPRDPEPRSFNRDKVRRAKLDRNDFTM
jgi:hypothetical protein